jgi:hypothetical protein
MFRFSQARVMLIIRVSGRVLLVFSLGLGLVLGLRLCLGFGYCFCEA